MKQQNTTSEGADIGNSIDCVTVVCKICNAHFQMTLVCIDFREYKCKEINTQ